MDWFNIVTIAVGLLTVGVNAAMIFYFGPVRAARLTRDLQREGAKKDRKTDVFRRVTATRGAPLNADHVWALNLVPIEFNDVPVVMAAWRTYLEHLRFRVPDDRGQQEAFFHERDKRLMTLLSAIAADVGITFDRMDLRDYSYIPQGWHDDEFEQRVSRKLLIDLLTGSRFLRVMPVVPGAGSGPYPPAPTAPVPPQQHPSS